MYKRKDITLSILKILDAGIEMTGDALDIFYLIMQNHTKK